MASLRALRAVGRATRGPHASAPFGLSAALRADLSRDTVFAMRHERQVAVLNRLLNVVSHGETEAACKETTVEVERYTSASRFEAERRILFRQFPIVVGHISDLPDVWTFLTHDDTGVPLLVSRTEGGQLHAMLNICR